MSGSPPSSPTMRRVNTSGVAGRARCARRSSTSVFRYASMSVTARLPLAAALRGQHRLERARMSSDQPRSSGRAHRAERPADCR